MPKCVAKGHRNNTNNNSGKKREQENVNKMMQILLNLTLSTSVSVRVLCVLFIVDDGVDLSLHNFWHNLDTWPAARALHATS